MTNAAPPLERLFAGGRHIRLLLFGVPPPELAIPPLDHVERVARLVRPGEYGPVVADPARLPFIEALFDRALVTTTLPSAGIRAELRELWRVTAPAGLLLLVVKARRRWEWQASGWTRDALAPEIEAAMFEVLDWRVETLPDRWHLILVCKRDGLRPALIGRVVEAVATVTV